MGLLAGTLQTIHGGGTGRPELQHFFVNQLGEDLLHVAGTLVREQFRKVLEIELGLGSGFAVQKINNNIFVVSPGDSPVPAARMRRRG